MALPSRPAFQDGSGEPSYGAYATPRRTALVTFNDRGRGHAVADAHHLQTKLASACLQAREHLGHEPHARGPQGMTVRNGAAPGIDLVHVGPEFARPG